MTKTEDRHRIKEGRLVQNICHGTDGIGQDVAEILLDLVGKQIKWSGNHGKME